MRTRRKQESYYVWLPTNAEKVAVPPYMVVRWSAFHSRKSAVIYFPEFISCRARGSREIRGVFLGPVSLDSRRDRANIDSIRWQKSMPVNPAILAIGIRNETVIDPTGRVLLGSLDLGGLGLWRRLGCLARTVPERRVAGNGLHQFHQGHSLADSLWRPLDPGHLRWPPLRHQP